MTSERNTFDEGPAIHGGPPAFAEPLHVGRPNIGDRETFTRFVDEMFDRRWLTNDGPLVKQFEHRIAEYLGVKHCIAMNNGTIALEIAIRAIGLSGEVIVPSYTFIATAHALHWQGITPVFADVDPKTQALDPEAVRRMITPRTTGIIGVHLWGRAAPAVELQTLADEYELELMFDAAHAFGCSLNGKMIGGFGGAEVFSFHATKFFNTFEGGAILTNDDALADKTRLMRNFGFAGIDNVEHPGTNGKMVEVCAAMGLTNLDSIDAVIDVNRRNYHAYRTALADLPGITLLEYDEAERNNFQYIVLDIGQECPRPQVLLAWMPPHATLSRPLPPRGTHAAAHRADSRTSPRSAHGNKCHAGRGLGSRGDDKAYSEGRVMTDTGSSAPSPTRTDNTPWKVP